MKQERGFTLVELIIVIAIIAILAGAIFVAIDPARRLHEARNARRQTDILTILDAIKKYQADNDGAHYPEIAGMDEGVFSPIAPNAILCDTTCSSETITSDCIDLTDIGTEYLAVIPQDPRVGTDEWSGYFVGRDANGAITVGVCEPEGEGPGGSGTPPNIRITR